MGFIGVCSFGVLKVIFAGFDKKNFFLDIVLNLSISIRFIDKEFKKKILHIRERYD